MASRRTVIETGHASGFCFGHLGSPRELTISAEAEAGMASNLLSVETALVERNGYKSSRWVPFVVDGVTTLVGSNVI